MAIDPPKSSGTNILVTKQPNAAGPNTHKVLSPTPLTHVEPISTTKGLTVKSANNQHHLDPLLSPNSSNSQKSPINQYTQTKVSSLESPALLKSLISIEKIAGIIQKNNQPIAATVVNVSQATPTQITLLKDHPLVKQTQASLHSQVVQHPQKTAQPNPSIPTKTQPNSPIRNEAGAPKIFLAEISIASETKIMLTKSPLIIGQQLMLDVLQTTKPGVQSAKVAENIFIVAKPVQPSVKEIIHESLKQSLPKQNNISNIIQTAISLTGIIEKNASTLSNSSSNSELFVALKKLSRHYLDKHLINDTKTIKKTLTDSGTILESKLKMVPKPSASPLNDGQGKAISHDIKTLLLTLKSILEKNSTLIQTNNEGLKRKELENKIKTNSTLGSTTLVASNKSTEGGLKVLGAIPQLLDQILAQKKNLSKSNNNNKPNTAITELHKQITSSLAKIQLNQTQSLIDRFSAQYEGTTATNHLHFEIPLKWDHLILPLALEIWEEDKQNDKNNPTTEKKNVWNVRLEFLLPDGNNFYAQIKALDANVSVKLWTNDKNTLTKIKQQTNTLADNLIKHGVTLEEIYVHYGSPPKTGNQLGVSLVDIKT